MIPGNPFTEILRESTPVRRMDETTVAVLALAFEQHQRNRLTAVTACQRGLYLPDDLRALAEEAEH